MRGYDKVNKVLKQAENIATKTRWLGLKWPEFLNERIKYQKTSKHNTARMTATLLGKL